MFPHLFDIIYFEHNSRFRGLYLAFFGRTLQNRERRFSQIEFRPSTAFFNKLDAESYILVKAN